MESTVRQRRALNVAAGCFAMVAMLAIAGACGPAPKDSRTAPQPTTVPVIAPPDAPTPAAGICAPAPPGSGTVRVVLGPDVAIPRCVVVTEDQHLIVVNEDEPTSVRLASSAADLEPSDSVTFGQPFGDYLAPGVHRLHVSKYGGAGPEIWLRG